LSWFFPSWDSLVNRNFLLTLRGKLPCGISYAFGPVLTSWATMISLLHLPQLNG
jgi:hypothetical protein